MLLPPDKKEDEAAAEAAAARLLDQSRRDEEGRHRRSRRSRRQHQRHASSSSAGGSGSRFLESFDHDEQDDEGSSDGEGSSSGGDAGDDAESAGRRRSSRSGSSRRHQGNRREVIRERDSEAAPPRRIDLPAQRVPPRRHRRHHHYSTLTPIPSSPLSSASSETDPLLLPPPYSEAETGLKRRNRRKLYLTIGAALLGAIVVALLTSTYVEYRDEIRRRRGGWIRGGIDGKGRWDTEWHHTTPLLLDETEPRNCDLFSEPIAADRRDLPSTSPTVYLTSAYFELPRSLRNLKIRGRGSALSGNILVVPAGTESSWNTGDAATNKTRSTYMIRVEASFADSNVMKSWHVCHFGQGDEQGILVAGPVSPGGRPHTSPWQRDYLRVNIFIDVPRDQMPNLDFDLDDEDVDEVTNGAATQLHTSTAVARRHGSTQRSRNTHGDLSISASHMTVGFVGPFIQYGIVFDTVEICSVNGPIQTDEIAANSIQIEADRSIISARHLEARDGVMVLKTSGEIVDCRLCIGAGDILLHNNAGWITGHYEAQVGIDVFTTEYPIEGYFHAGKVWLRNSNARIRGTFEGIRYANGTGGLLAQTTNANIDARVALVGEVEPRRVSSSQMIPESSSADPVLVRLMTPSGDVRMNLTHIDAGVVTHITLGTGNGEAESILVGNFQADLEVSNILTNKIWLDEFESGGRDRLVARQPDGYRNDKPYWVSRLTGRIHALDGDDLKASGLSRINYDTSENDVWLTL